MKPLSSEQVPPEVWTRVFGYLSEADKSSVRASCKRFKKVVDHWSLWKGWTIVLRFKNGSYNSQFWATLRRRKVTSVLMRSTKAKDWKELALQLPALSTVAVEDNLQGSFGFFKDFPHLKRLAVRHSTIDAITLSQAQQLTHLTLCRVVFPAQLKESFSDLPTQLKSLTHLVCHHLDIFEGSVRTIDTLLVCLPKLQHLSISFKETLPNSVRAAPDVQRTSVLTSLELVHLLHSSLPESIMKLMPCLRSLTLFYKHSYDNTPVVRPPPVSPLGTWLRDLPQLSTLVIDKGPPVYTYTACIPPTVTSLTLRGTRLSERDMTGIALQVPNLLHLYMYPWPSHLGAQVAQIPKLFPKLRILKLRLEHVSEKDILQLHQLQDLEYLEILDDLHNVSDLAGKLQALTNQRLRVAISTCPTVVMSCYCVSYVY